MSSHRPFVLCSLLVACVTTPPVLEQPLDYPVSKRVVRVDEYHGVTVDDPYRWLEEGADSEEVAAWIEAQNRLTFEYLSAIPQRDGIRERLDELSSYERVGLPIFEAGNYFVSHNTGLEDQPKLMVAESPDGPWRELLDPTEFAADGTVSVAGLAPSPDGHYLAYGLSDGGSDWREIHLVDVATGRKLNDVVRNCKFDVGEWAHDSSGFYYTRFERPRDGSELSARNEPPETWFHHFGTDESEDVRVLGRADDPMVFQGLTLTEDRRAAVVSRLDARSRKTELDWVAIDPERPSMLREDTRVPLVAGYESQDAYIGDDGSIVFVQTTRDAPNGRVVAIDPKEPDEANWTEIVPEADEAIRSVSLVGGHLVVGYMKDVASVVEIYDRDGNFVREVDLPGFGTASGFRGDFDRDETFFSFSSYTQPPTLWRYDVATGERSRFWEVELPFDPSRYVTRQEFYESKDGTRIPIAITHERGIELDGQNATYLYGYGGFNVSLTPRFSVATLAWLELGGIHAVPNLRGGGEYGEAWHAAGTKENKQNVFDDFIAAAEWLCDQGYTSPEKLAIGGSSNGGLLVGACMTQRPELFAATLPSVGVMDMLRYHKFTIGWAWAGDYGTSDDPDEFRVLRAYSPYHNLEQGVDYPATLVTTGDHDDRVVPAHSFKFAARLQHVHIGLDPVLIRIETRAGHGAGKSTSMRLDETADRWAFLTHVLDM